MNCPLSSSRFETWEKRKPCCCGSVCHGVALLRGIRHPEPSGSRRATPALLFQHSVGQSRQRPSEAASVARESLPNASQLSGRMANADANNRRKRTDPAQFERFIEAARKRGINESLEDFAAKFSQDRAAKADDQAT